MIGGICDHETEKTMHAVFDVPSFGKVRVTFERTRYCHDKHLGKFWSGKHAEVVDAVG